MTNSTIDILLYSYKGKHLKEVVDSILDNTESKVFITLIDQSPILKDEIFGNIQNMNYRHARWDAIQSPCEYRQREIESSRSNYFLIISDDIVLSKGWDRELISFVDQNDSIVSGDYLPSISHKDLFSLKKSKQPCHGMCLTNYIDRNFIFGKTSTFKKIKYPGFLKYNGEEEMTSLLFFMAGVQIFSARPGLYKDLGLRPIENLYVPFSLDHNYNKFIEYIAANQDNEKLREFFMFHNLDISRIKRLPFDTNDPEYDPYNLNYLNVDHTKFLSQVNAIY